LVIITASAGNISHIVRLKTPRSRSNDPTTFLYIVATQIQLNGSPASPQIDERVMTGKRLRPADHIEGSSKVGGDGCSANG
jgi:hypothetical protein